METDKDHIHILLGYDTTERICDIISILKRGCMPNNALAAIDGTAPAAAAAAEEVTPLA